MYNEVENQALILLYFQKKIKIIIIKNKNKHFHNFSYVIITCSKEEEDFAEEVYTLDHKYLKIVEFKKFALHHRIRSWC